MHVKASPEVVFEVVSRPEHIREWWSDDASLNDVAPGAVGEVVWGDRAQVESFTVVEVDRRAGSPSAGSRPREKRPRRATHSW
ncbi:SRPBCC domain-containing protein [Knoellia sp. CPCC 206453]|uniref:SRPBCC domain-containing protein n=1 Tax=Knoellia pratensis TaxID=3404796 RepID=UPI0036172748